MKYYYYIENKKKFGPYSIEDLKVKQLKKSTLVWTEGTSDWATADSFVELQDILISEPPPIPKKNNLSKMTFVLIGILIIGSIGLFCYKSYVTEKIPSITVKKMKSVESKNDQKVNDSIQVRKRKINDLMLIAKLHPELIDEVNNKLKSLGAATIIKQKVVEVKK